MKEKTPKCARETTKNADPASLRRDLTRSDTGSVILFFLP